jgi:hypothetical protein
MTGAAICAELFFVGIVFGVTGIAITGRAFEDIIDMTTGARHTGMCASQLEA